MAICLLDTVLPASLPLGSGGSAGQGDEIASRVQAALSALDALRPAVERRRQQRYPYPYPVHVTPLEDDGQPALDKTFVVIGKHLSPQGFDFYSPQPLADNRVIISLDCGRQGWTGILLELAWCRFSRHGWYDNGGRFLALVTSPLLSLDNRPRAA